MTMDDFIKNLGGVDGGKDFDVKLLRGIYKAIKKQQFIGGADHVAQTQHLQHKLVQSSNTASGKTFLKLRANYVIHFIAYNIANYNDT